jgi:hypothetical protein
MEWFPEDQFLKADGLDEAVIGYCEHSLRLIYSRNKVLEILMSWEMDEEEAHEYFMFNIHQAYMGDMTPIWCMD